MYFLLSELAALQDKNFYLSTTIFVDSFYHSLQDVGEHLFRIKFNTLPNKMYISGKINFEEASRSFYEKHKAEINDCMYIIDSYENSGKEDVGIFCYNISFFIYEDLMIHFKEFERKVEFLYRKTSAQLVVQLMNEILEFKIADEKLPNIYLLVNSTDSGIKFEKFKLKKPELNVEENYNDDFISIHQTILNRLNTEKT